MLPGPLLTTDLVDIGFHGAIVALCDVEHLGEEALDFLIKGNAIRIGVIGDGQFVITIAVFYHGVVAFQHRLNPLPSGFSTSSTLVEVLDNQMQGDAGSGRLFRSEEHTSELQSLMRISYAVFCLKKKTNHNRTTYKIRYTREHKHIRSRHR